MARQFPTRHDPELVNRKVVQFPDEFRPVLGKGTNCKTVRDCSECSRFSQIALTLTILKYRLTESWNSQVCSVGLPVPALLVPLYQVHNEHSRTVQLGTSRSEKWAKPPKNQALGLR